MNCWQRLYETTILRLLLMDNAGQKIKVVILMVMLCSTATVSLAQRKSETITISEPATVSLESLFAQADLVAFVTILSGDAEHYKAAVYKAQITKSYKGPNTDSLIYFGPFVSYGIGSEYLVFLKKTNQNLVNLVDPTKPKVQLPFDGSQFYYRIMYEGYSVMPVKYECIFNGTGHNGCDYGVRFNTYQVELPSTLKAFPINVGDFPLNRKSVRRDDVERALSALVKKR